MPMMNILAFDLGTTWARAGNIALLETVHHDKLIGDARPTKLAMFKNYLEWLSWEHYDLVVYERPFARGQAATRFLWGMAGILEAAAAPYCAVSDVTPAEIKRWATGHGNATKESMMLAAALSLGYGGDNEHEADAYCLLKYAEAVYTTRKS